MYDKIEPTMFALGFFVRNEKFPDVMAIDYLVTVDTNNVFGVEDW